MAKATFRKTKTGFTYSGDLRACIESAKRKIENLNKDTAYVTRRYEEEKRKFKAHFTAIENAKDFIWLAEEKLKEEERKNGQQQDV